jgi:cAMP-dependent protein kinase regulator
MPAPESSQHKHKSISSECYCCQNGKTSITDDFKPPVFEKTPAQQEAIRQRMAGNFLFDSLDPRDFERLVNAFSQVEVAAGDVVIRQGDDGDQFYLVE